VLKFHGSVILKLLSQGISVWFNYYCATFVWTRETGLDCTCALMT